MGNQIYTRSHSLPFYLWIACVNHVSWSVEWFCSSSHCINYNPQKWGPMEKAFLDQSEWTRGLGITGMLIFPNSPSCIRGSLVSPGHDSSSPLLQKDLLWEFISGPFLQHSQCPSIGGGKRAGLPFGREN